MPNLEEELRLVKKDRVQGFKDRPETIDEYLRMLETPMPDLPLPEPAVDFSQPEIVIKGGEVRVKGGQVTMQFPSISEVDFATRQRILQRDGSQCTRCKCSTDLHVHHIVPRRLGGTADDINLITLCSKCHGAWEANFRHHMLFIIRSICESFGVKF